MSGGLEHSCSFQPRSQLRPDRGTLRISCGTLHYLPRCLERGQPARSRRQRERGQRKASAELLSQRLDDVEPCFGSWLFLLLASLHSISGCFPPEARDRQLKPSFVIGRSLTLLP